MTEYVNVHRQLLQPKSFYDAALHAFKHIWERIESQERNGGHGDLLNWGDVGVNADDVVFEVVEDDDG